MIEREDRDGIAILRMVRGKGNAMNIEFLEAIIRALDDVISSNARAAVLTANGNIFCVGVDLPSVTAGGAEYLARFHPVLGTCFRKMALFPKPLITAVNGHAIAGGCIGILASDYRIVANNGGRIGLTELLVGVPFPTWALEIARFAIPTQYFQEIIYTGRTYPPQEALSRGLVDEVVPAENLLDRACEVAHQMGAIPSDSFRISKFQIREPLVARCERLAPQDDPGVLAVWSRPDIQQHINEFVARTVKRTG